MSICKDIEHQIIEYIDGTLNVSDHEKVKQHINGCETCKKVESEYRLLFTTLNKDSIELPGTNLKESFEAALAKEETVLQEAVKNRGSKTIQISPSAFYKVAAILALMLSCYWLGNFRAKKVFVPELADLTSVKKELKTVAALSLFESESASKRIQAVKYSRELKDPDEDILHALINEMLHDKLVNVRLASAWALERFSAYQMVRDAFIEALKTEENTSMQIELIEILVHVKEKRAIPKMKELLKDDNTPVFIKEQLKSKLQHLI